MKNDENLKKLKYLKNLQASSIKKNWHGYITKFILGLFILTTLTSVGFAALNQNLNIAGELDFSKNQVWASNLSFNQSHSGINCSTAQCMIDCLANENLCPPPPSFANDPWQTIVENVHNGNTRYYNVGDTKTITVSNNQYTIRIANKSTPSECSNPGFSQTACGFVLEFVDIVRNRSMNSTLTNIGGWPQSAMRTDVEHTFESIVMAYNPISTTVVSSHGSGDSNDFVSQDYVYLLSEAEVLGTYSTTTRQLDYYEMHNVATDSNFQYAIKGDDQNYNSWWLRSATYTDTTTFRIVDEYGRLSSASATSFLGVSPAFRIG